MEVKKRKSPEPEQMRLGDLETKTLVEYQSHTYVILSRSGCGAGIIMKWDADHTVLLNPKAGSLRSVLSDTLVTVLNGLLEVWESSCPKNFLKDDCLDY